MFAIMMVMIMCRGTSLPMSGDAHWDIESFELSFFPECSNRDVELDLGYFGVLPIINSNLAKSVRVFRGSPAIQRKLLKMLGDKDQHAVAQLLLANMYGWDKSAHDQFPGSLGLEIDQSSHLIFTQERATALRSYWKARIGALQAVR
jgi:hypothetical protein